MKVLKRLLAVLAVLIVIAGVAVTVTDKPLRDTAQNTAAASLQQAGLFSDKPAVTIEGFPFLWGGLTGFPAVKVEGASMPMTVQGKAVTLRDASFTLTGVKVGGSAVTASALDGTITLTYADLGTLAGGRLSHGEGERIVYKATTDILGLNLEAVVTGVPSLDVAAQSVTIKEATLSVAGVSLPDALVNQVLDHLIKPTSVPLEYGLSIREIAATEAGLQLRVGGSGVTLPLKR